MRLYEEYLKRHNIDDVPLVHHVNNSCIVFKTTDYKIWHELLSMDSLSSSNFILPSAGIVYIKWIHNDHHPGHYEVSLHHQIHDGYINDQIFSNKVISNLKWHEYESFIHNFMRIFKKTHLIKDKDEAFILCWEMFVASYDSWFSKQGGDIKYMLFQTLDEELQISTRLDLIAEILKKLAYNASGVFRNWKYEVLNKVQHFAEWFVELIDKNAKELLPCKD